ncbi:MAG TPA: GDP-L-fucose synthase [Reyranella sp.]|nr:GDP-L-fucose synthase [Reyranella sp.]
MTGTAPDAGDHYDLAGKRVWVAGHTGMVGSAVARRLSSEACTILVADHGELDLTRQSQTEAWVRHERPDAVVVAAARVGGILANAQHPADFLYENVMIAVNVMRAAYENGVEKLLWLSSSCVYPRDAPQPIREEMLLSGPLEKTNEAYAIAKIAGLKLAAAYNTQHSRRFITAMPTNIYGPNDNFDASTSHVLPALMRKFHEAKMAGRRSVTLWGTGTPLREFLHVDDLADACVFLLRNYADSEPVNIGSGEEVSIHDLARLVAQEVGFEGVFVYDTTKPNGTPRKRLDTSKMDAMGWKPRIGLGAGIRDLYEHWLSRGDAFAAS